MTKILFRVLLGAMFLIGIQHSVSAHTMWMTLDNSAQNSEMQTVNVYFGEYSDAQPTPYNKWFSNLKDVAVFMENPDGKIEQLKNGTASDNCLSFQFPTSKDGLYKIYFEHEVKDVFKGMKITYASVVVYEKNYQKGATIGFYDVELKWKKLNAGSFTYLENGRPKANASITAAKGGQKGSDVDLVASKKGQMSFDKTAHGDYLLEVVVKKEVEDQTHGGKAFSVDYKMFTYKIVL